MYKRVLVATGGSPWSDAALAYAIAWAAYTGAELRILTVLASPVAYTMPDVMSSSEFLMESVERQGQRCSTALQRRLPVRVWFIARYSNGVISPKRSCKQSQKKSAT